MRRTLNYATSVGGCPAADFIETFKLDWLANAHQKPNDEKYVYVNTRQTLPNTGERDLCQAYIIQQESLPSPTPAPASASASAPATKPKLRRWRITRLTAINICLFTQVFCCCCCCCCFIFFSFCFFFFSCANYKKIIISDTKRVTPFTSPKKCTQKVLKSVHVYGH